MPSQLSGCSGGSSPVRAALAAAVPLLASPELLAAAFDKGFDPADVAQKCENALLQASVPHSVLNTNSQLQRLLLHDG